MADNQRVSPNILAMGKLRFLSQRRIVQFC